MEKARAKLRVARDLVERGEWDDRVSRAYYAAFHAAQAAVLCEGERADTHQGVLTLFGLLLVKTGKIDRKWGRALAEADGFVNAVGEYVARQIDQADNGTV